MLIVKHFVFSYEYRNLQKADNESYSYKTENRTLKSIFYLFAFGL